MLCFKKKIRESCTIWIHNNYHLGLLSIAEFPAAFSWKGIDNALISLTWLLLTAIKWKMKQAKTKKKKNVSKNENRKEKKTRKRIKKGTWDWVGVVELHYGPGMVLRTLLLFVLGFTKLRRKMGQNSSVKTVLNTVQARPQNGQIHLYNLRVLLQQQKLHCVPVSLASLRVTEATSPGHMHSNNISG